MKRKALLIAMLVAATAVAMVWPGATTSQAQDLREVVLTPVADTYVVLGDNNPQGRQTTLDGGIQNFVGEYHVLMKFNMADPKIGDDAEVVSATLRMYRWTPCSIDGPAPVYEIRKVIRDWDETNVIWDNAPTSAGPTERFTVSDGDSLGWTEANLLKHVTDWMNKPNENDGLLIIPTWREQNKLCRWRSREIGSWPLNNPPLLVLQVRGGTTPTASPQDTYTPSATPTASNTPTPTETPSVTDTPTPTDTPTVTNTPTETPNAPAYLPVALSRWDYAWTPAPTPIPSETDVMDTPVPDTPEATTTSEEPAPSDTPDGEPATNTPEGDTTPETPEVTPGVTEEP